MSGVSQVTSQLNGVPPCTPEDCCDQIAALTARVDTLTARVVTLETQMQTALPTAVEAKKNADKALGEIVSATIAIGALGSQVGLLSGLIAAANAQIAAILAALARLSALVAPVVAALPGILIAIAALGALALSVAAAQTLAASAYGLADTAMRIGNEGIRIGSNAMLRATDAAAQAVNALNAAIAASSKADTALSGANDARNTASSALSVANTANGTANRAIAIAEPLPGRISEVERVTGIAIAQSDRALVEATAASIAANRAQATAAAAAARSRTPGATGAPGRVGTPGATGAPGKDAISDPSLPIRVRRLEEVEVIMRPAPGGGWVLDRVNGGPIVRVPPDRAAEIVSVKSDVTKLGGDLEPLKQDNNRNKAAIATIQETCCKPDKKVEFEPVLLQKFVNCNPQTKEPVFATYMAQVIKGTAIKEQTQAAQLAGIEGQRCKEFSAIATVPEWWQLRPEAKRKQAVLISREIRSDGTIGNDPYPITIPHFNQSSPPSTPPLPEYEKGNFEGILTLKDNSKVIVHCKTADECSRVLGAISAYIETDYLVGSTSKIGQRKNMAFKSIRVKAWRLDYYPSGVQSLKPIWLKSYF